jgi:hypothetical protein
MLEADLLLKKTAARLLHPDHPLGARFWDELYGWVGAKGVKMCHSFRQWIVPGKVELQLQQPEQPGRGEGGAGGGGGGDSSGGSGGGGGGGGDGQKGHPRNDDHDGSLTSPPSLLHILRAPLLVKQEAEYASGGGGLAPIAQDAEGAVRELCHGADPKAREKAGELFDTIVLPELQRAVNEEPGYHALRAMFLWRVVGELYTLNAV